MKIYRPLQISINNRVLERNGRFYFVISESIGFSLTNSKAFLEFDVAKEIYPAMGEKPLPDLGMPKPQGEYLVSGSYFSSENKPVTGDEVKVVLGNQKKNLYVFGNRHWQNSIPSKPDLLSELKLDYKYAFGGAKDLRNPIGIGFQDSQLPCIEYPHTIITSQDDRPEPAGFAPVDPSLLQRMQYSGTYGADYREKYFPGYPQDFDWRFFMTAPQDQWVNGYYRGDEPFALYNMHPEISCIQGALPNLVSRCFCLQSVNGKKTEFFELPMNLDTVWFFPGKMMGLLIWRATFEVHDDEASQITHLLAAYERKSDSQRSLDYYRAAIDRRITSNDSLLDGLNTEDLIAINDKCAMEQLQENAFAKDDGPSEFSKNLDAKDVKVNAQVNEYLENAKKQLNEKTAEIINLPPDTKKVIEEMLNPVQQSPQVVSDPDQIKMNAAIDELVPGLMDADPSKIELKKFSFDKIDKVFEEINKFTDKKSKQAEALLKDATKAGAADAISNLQFPDDFPPEIKQDVLKKIEALSNPVETVDEPAPLPRINRNQFGDALELLSPESAGMMQHIAAMKSAGVADDVISNLEKQITSLTDTGSMTGGFEKTASDFRELYAPVAHYLRDGLSPHKEKIEQITQQFLEKVKSGEPVANGDWACIDLSFKKLDGIDFSGCFLEQVNFKGASLKAANFTDAIMCRAQLENANFTEAKFTRCNIGAVHAGKANFSSADMSDAILTNGDFTGAKLTRSNLTGAEIRETNFTSADLSGADIPAAMFINSTVEGVMFNGARMTKSVFMQCQLIDLNFSGADLSNSVWAETPLERVCFDNATMIQACFAATNPQLMPLKECSFAGAKLDKANFQGLLMKNANLKQASAENANFANADLSGADLSGINAPGAQFRKTILKDANLDRANLMNGSLAKAQLENASFNGANLFTVDFLRSNIVNTTFKNCNLDNTLIEEWKSK